MGERPRVILGLAAIAAAILTVGAVVADVPTTTKSYEAAFKELYEQLGREYPNFELKKIDWKKVGEELLPASRAPMSTDEFSLLCQRLVARLEDSHAAVGGGTSQPATVPLPRWDPGFACLIDDRDRPIIFTVVPGSLAAAGGLRPGMTIASINGTLAAAALKAYGDTLREYFGYSSHRLLRHDAARSFHRQRQRGAQVQLEIETVDGNRKTVDVTASLDTRYVPRLPVPIEGISDSADLSFKRLDERVGYIYVRRIRPNLIVALDRAVGELHDCRGLVIDVRGNSGGGFDADRAFRNFDPTDQNERGRPRYLGPIAVLIDSRCISAGEGWVSWFKAKNRGKFFGETTAGASSRKKTIDVAGGLFRVTYPVKAYTGFLDRPIERLGIVPDIEVRPNAKDLSRGTDTVLEAARKYLIDSLPPTNSARP
jgi:carboxyl-terminal processing protease